MKNLICILSLIIGLSANHASAFEAETLKLQCQAADGSTFVMDQFHKDPCQIRKIKEGHEEVITGISLCIFPDDVHDDFSFWWMIPNQSKVELVGELEAVGNLYQGSLSYNSANSGSALTSLICKTEESPR